MLIDSGDAGPSTAGQFLRRADCAAGVFCVFALGEQFVPLANGFGRHPAVLEFGD
jgi:hypothetical protein